MKMLRLIPPEPDSGLTVAGDAQALWINAERRPQLIQLEREDGLLIVRDEAATSGTLHVTASIGTARDVVINTGILLLRREPYRLAAELARGQANKLRNVVAQWELEGWRIPDDLQPFVRCLASDLCQAVQTSGISADAIAVKALESALILGDQLVESYATHRLRVRGDNVPLPQLACASMDALDSSRPGSESLMIGIDWARLEQSEGDYDWGPIDERLEECAQQNITPIVGPILDFHESRFPQWLLNWKTCQETLLTLMVDRVESVIGRYADRVSHWIVTHRTNKCRMLPLYERELEALTSRLLEAAFHVQPKGVMAVGIDDPWGWYAGMHPFRSWPVDFLDCLSRIGPIPSAALLDLTSEDDFCRTALDHFKLLDRYKRLEIPLWPMVDSGFASCRVRSQPGESRVSAALLGHPATEQLFLSPSLLEPTTASRSTDSDAPIRHHMSDLRSLLGNK